MNSLFNLRLTGKNHRVNQQEVEEGDDKGNSRNYRNWKQVNSQDNMKTWSLLVEKTNEIDIPLARIIIKRELDSTHKWFSHEKEI